MRIMLTTDGTDYDGEDAFTPPYTPNPPYSYAIYSADWTSNPKTESAWTVADINGLEAGAHATSGTNALTYLYVEVAYETNGFVVPEIPLGTVTAVALPFLALAGVGYRNKRRH